MLSTGLVVHVRRSRSCDVKVSDEGKTMSPDHLSTLPIIEFIFVHSHNVQVLDASSFNDIIQGIDLVLIGIFFASSVGEGYL